MYLSSDLPACRGLLLEDISSRLRLLPLMSMLGVFTVECSGARFAVDATLGVSGTIEVGVHMTIGVRTFVGIIELPAACACIRLRLVTGLPVAASLRSGEGLVAIEKIWLFVGVLVMFANAFRLGVLIFTLD